VLSCDFRCFSLFGDFWSYFWGFSLGGFEGVSSRFLLWASRMRTWCLFYLVILPPQICGKAFDLEFFKFFEFLR
jgi:hypothetical protein